ncbi:PREDICTED: uncharacterized protein LOC109230005 [Nicotiana attenuata]|uniref:uncharacterized protein LOC109230005 n=1 Tax=Nicotiana attenuata TaxID=49451 RepID=UPI000904A7BD|nr:PREDICTED: uncharacterized protein LOC109230005 [Nicotiana attenuata]
METEMSFSQLAPPVFDGENYQLWAVRMETYLESLDLWEAVEEDYDVHPLPNNPTVAQIKSHKEKKTRKSKAKATLFAGVSATIFTRVMALKSAKEIWDYLKGEYTRDERIRGMKVLNLIREFELQKMKESETVKEYSDRLLGIVNKAQEQRRLMRQDGMVEEALAANHKTQSKAVICKGKYQKHEADAQVANEEEEDHLFVATILSTKKSDFWLIDSGCKNHMTYDRNLFKEFTSIGNKKVRIGNGDYILAKGKGTVAIPTNSGTKKISDVLYVPDIDQNLLSVGQLMEKGFKVSFEDKYCFIYDATGLEILRVKMRGKNFSFDPTEDEEWSQKNLLSVDNSPTEDICENKKIDKSQGKMQMKLKNEPTYFINNHEMQQNTKVNSIHCKSKDQLADLRTKSLPVKGLQGKNSEFAASKARRSVRNML